MAFLSRSNIMLCYPAEEKRISKLPNQIIVQPKLNGERCRVEWFQDKPVLLSSYGNEFKFCDNIIRQLVVLSSEMGGSQIPFDGEVYVHGWERERIHSALSRKKTYNPDVEKLEFHIFDVQFHEPLQWQRTVMLENYREVITENNALKLVETKVIERNDWLSHCQDYIISGYEGIILRHPGGIYENKRSPAILKFKPTEHDDYLIVGYNQEVDIHGSLKDSLGSFIVASPEGRFAVGTGPALTKDERERLWRPDIRAGLIGKTLRVKHEAGRTNGGIPIATVAVEVR